MRVPLSWLQSYVGELGSLDELVATLDDLGLVVEGVEHVGASLDGVVVVRVEQIEAIEGADRIRLATVTDGAEHVQVVCGAWNYEVGSLVPFAPVGTVLPDGTEIGRRTMRGVVSNGMLCSGRELGVGEDHAGLLVLDEVDGAVPGRAVREVLGLEADVVLDLSIEGNRPDAWCVEGVARDLAARLDRPFQGVVPPAPPVPSEAAAPLAASIEDPDLCGRLVVTVVHDVVIGPSPGWLARRLELAGMRPINNVVDASNYVMLELGQPTHPYDLGELHGGISVRRAREGERLELLDGSVLELAVHSGALGDTGEDLVICDGRDAPVGLAGIMGGATSGVSAATTAVALEAAWFEPLSVARSAKRHRQRTEASARFERGCDWSNCDRAARRFVQLLAESSPSSHVAATPIDLRGSLPEPIVLDVDEHSLAARLGVELSRDEVVRLLEAIGFATGPSASGPLHVTVPTGRPDVRPAPFGVADVAEEVARLHGFSRLPVRVPTWAAPGGLDPRVAARRSIREALVGIGALEAWTATMVAVRDASLLGDDTERVRVTNPMSAEAPALRSSLLPGLLAALSFNVERRQGDVALFEVGTVFTHPSHAPTARMEKGGAGGTELLKVPSEAERIGVVLGRPGDDVAAAVAAWGAICEALRLEHVRLERDDRDTPPHGVHATRYARLVDARTRRELGIVGEVDPSVAERAVPSLAAGRRLGWLDLSLDALCDPAQSPRRTEEASIPSRYPSSDVDLALVVAESVHVDDVKQVLRDAAGELCESVVCFDAYRGGVVPEAHRSLAMRVRLCAADRTLSEEELAATRGRMIDAARARLSATLR
jgi:phenylalanyl-tRNA synthetase beta chain